jgi:Flp pilus assembly protein TadD
VAFSPDSKRLASGGEDRTVRVWDAHTGRQLLSLKGHPGVVTSVAFSPDGKRLVSSDGNWNQATWDLSTGQALGATAGHSLDTFPRSPDGSLFALAEGNVIRIHRLPSGAADRPGAYRWWADPDYHWHAEQARQSQSAGDWFATAFHLGRQLPQRPWDAALHIRLAYALGRLGRPVEATTRYLQALLLNPRLSPWPLDPDAGRRGQGAAQAGAWPRAAAELELAAHQPRATFATWSDWLLARTALAPQGARVSCGELLDRFANSPGAAQQLVSSCVAIPSEPAEARRLLDVTQRVAAARRDATSLTWLGAALYRADRCEEAERTLQDAIKAQGKGGYVDSWLFLAMAQQRLGRVAAARTTFAHFEKWLKGQTFSTWQQTLRWQLLHEEARRLVLTMPRAAE